MFGAVLIIVRSVASPAKGSVAMSLPRTVPLKAFVLFQTSTPARIVGEALAGAGSTRA